MMRKGSPSGCDVPVVEERSAHRLYQSSPFALTGAMWREVKADIQGF